MLKLPTDTAIQLSALAFLLYLIYKIIICIVLILDLDIMYWHSALLNEDLTLTSTTLPSRLCSLSVVSLDFSRNRGQISGKDEHYWG